MLSFSVEFSSARARLKNVPFTREQRNATLGNNTKRNRKSIDPFRSKFRFEPCLALYVSYRNPARLSLVHEVNCQIVIHTHIQKTIQNFVYANQTQRAEQRAEQRMFNVCTLIGRIGGAQSIHLAHMRTQT